jgi:hypothetical protein
MEKRILSLRKDGMGILKIGPNLECWHQPGAVSCALKIALMIFGNKLEGELCERFGVIREFGRQLLRGAISLGVCALVTLCVGWFLSLLASGSKAQPTGSCKASSCVVKKGDTPRVTASKRGPNSF